MSDDRVCSVLNPAFGEFLKKFDTNVPIWIVESEENSAVAAELWKSGQKNITTFRAQQVAGLLWTVDEHHPNWRKLEFHGLEIEEARKAVISEFGEGLFETFGAGFVFERPSTIAT